MSGHERTKIVIVGAGFAGINVARELARRLPHEEDGAITLVDQNNFMLFTPMLTEVVSGQVETSHVVSAVRRLSPRVTFVQGRVDGIDLARKRVMLTVGGTAEGIPRSSRTLEADQLVIALGSVTNYHGIPGVREHALTIKSVGDAAAIRNRALELLEYAAAEPAPGGSAGEAAPGEPSGGSAGEPASGKPSGGPGQTQRSALLTFVVGGGGFSGVETMAALNDLVRDTARRYPRIQADDIRTVLVHPEKRLLPEIDARLAYYAQMKLQQRGVEVILDTEITGACADGVELKGGRHIPTHLLVWTAGVMPSPVIGVLDARRGHHGGIAVAETCAVPDHPGVWALGDCAEVPHSGSKKAYAPTAQNATREGTLVARNIVAVLHGKKPRPFAYKPIGELAIVGRRSGVASLYGLRCSGLLAWAMWRAVYLAKMPLAGKRARIGLDWLLDLGFGRQVEELPIARSTPSAGEAHR